MADNIFTSDNENLSNEKCNATNDNDLSTEKEKPKQTSLLTYMALMRAAKKAIEREDQGQK